MSSSAAPYSVTSTEVKHAGVWLRFVEKKYRHRDGHEIVYESVDRVTSPPGQVSAVIVVPRFGDSFVLVKQYRAPVDAWVVEFPAGLTDPGESPEAAALRELAEETGFSGVVTSVSGRCAAEPSLTSADEVFVSVRCHSRGQQATEADEDIEVLTVPAGQLSQRLAALSAEAGCLICTRLRAFALGLEAAAASV